MNLLDTICQFYYELTIKELKSLNTNHLYPNISYNSLMYLDIIAYKENCTASDLSAALNISKAAVTIKTNELVKEGLITKTQSKKDKRINYLNLTDKYKEDFALDDIRFKNIVNKVESTFSKDDIQTFCKVLNLLSNLYTEEENEHGSNSTK